jgi:hypothetical protein
MKFSQLEKLDCYKVCFELTIQTDHAIKDIPRVEENDVLQRLAYSALRALGRIAFSTGARGLHGAIKFKHIALMQAIGWLMEFENSLSLARVMGMLSVETCDNLDALRGRGVFYIQKYMEADLK